MNHVDVRSSLKMAGLAMILAVGSLACSQRVEDNPVIKEKFKELERISQDQKKSQREVAMLQQDVEALTESFNTAIKNVGAESSPETAAKIADLEKQLAALEARAGSLGSRSSSSSKEVADAATSSGSDEVKPASSSKARSSESSSAKKASKPAVEKPSAPTGFYYTTKTGDTFESIASRNNISVTRLKEANRLRGSATLYPAQPIYIPTK